MAIATQHAVEHRKDLYPSRVHGEPEVLDRKDPVVYGSAEDGPLNQSELDRYERDGFLFFPGLFSEREMEFYRGELRRLNRRPDNSDRPEIVTEPGTNEVRSVFAIHENNEVLGRLLRDQRVLDIARQLLGSEVYFHQSRINYKPGFEGKEFYWHSDLETWHTEDGLPRMRTVSCSILLTENDAHNGPLMLIPGSHKEFVACVGPTPEDNYRESLQRQEVGVPDRDNLRRLAEQGGIQAPTGPAGSVVFFECNTMHGSNGNITPKPRSNVFGVYNSVHNRPEEPFAAPKRRPEWIANRSNTGPVHPA